MMPVMTDKGFEDEIVKLANEQSELVTRIRDLLEDASIPYNQYCDWLDDYCLWRGDQIGRLVELYREANPNGKLVKTKGEK